MSRLIIAFLMGCATTLSFTSFWPEKQDNANVREVVIDESKVIESYQKLGRSNKKEIQSLKQSLVRDMRDMMRNAVVATNKSSMKNIKQAAIMLSESMEVLSQEEARRTESVVLQATVPLWDNSERIGDIKDKILATTLRLDETNERLNKIAGLIKSSFNDKPGMDAEKVILRPEKAPLTPIQKMSEMNDLAFKFVSLYEKGNRDSVKKWRAKWDTMAEDSPDNLNAAANSRLISILLKIKEQQKMPKSSDIYNACKMILQYKSTSMQLPSAVISILKNKDEKTYLNITQLMRNAIKEIDK